MSSTIAVFQIVKNNVLAPDPSNPIFSVQNGQEVAQAGRYALFAEHTAYIEVL